MGGYLVKRINNLYDNMISYSNILFVFNKIKNKCHNKNKFMIGISCDFKKLENACKTYKKDYKPKRVRQI